MAKIMSHTNIISMNSVVSKFMKTKLQGLVLHFEFHGGDKCFISNKSAQVVRDAGNHYIKHLVADEHRLYSYIGHIHTV